MMLIEDNVNVNCSDYDKRTALHLAAGEGKVETLQALLNAGADPNAEDRFGNRPLDDAIRKEAAACVQALKKFGGMKGSSSRALEQRDLGVDDSGHKLDKSSQYKVDALRVEWTDLEVVDKIGAGEVRVVREATSLANAFVE